VYSTHRDAFTEDHRRIIEVIARQVSKTVKYGIGFERNRLATFRDRLTGLPNLEHLERFIASEMAFGSADAPLSIIFIDAQSSRGFNKRGVRPASTNQRVADVADAVRKALRGADVLFRYGDEEFVVLLTHTDSAAAVGVLGRIETCFRDADLASQSTGDAALTVTVGVASAPADGTTLADLVQVARHREQPLPPDPPQHRSSIH
jgi:diguanylate cyclase (GGDEF)-like protein